MIKKIVFIFFLSIGCTLQLSAQEGYDQAAGIRGGSLTGASFKKFIIYHGAIEGILGYNFANGKFLSATGLYEHHIFFNYQLAVYGGGGLTLGTGSGEFRLNGEVIVGIEYTFPNFPANFSIDYKPSYHLIQGEFVYNEAALTLRYVF